MKISLKRTLRCTYLTNHSIPVTSPCSGSYPRPTPVNHWLMPMHICRSLEDHINDEAFWVFLKSHLKVGSCPHSHFGKITWMHMCLIGDEIMIVIIITTPSTKPILVDLNTTCRATRIIGRAEGVRKLFLWRLVPCKKRHFQLPDNHKFITIHSCIHQLSIISYLHPFIISANITNPRSSEPISTASEFTVVLDAIW